MFRMQWNVRTLNKKNASESSEAFIFYGKQQDKRYEILDNRQVKNENISYLVSDISKSDAHAPSAGAVVSGTGAGSGAVVSVGSVGLGSTLAMILSRDL